jgi:predicted transposase
MKLTIKAKLLANKEQYLSLKETMETFNDACNFISHVAFENKRFGQVSLHHLVYRQAREKFPKLSSQFIVRSIAKVSDSYVAEPLSHRRILHPEPQC